MFQTNKDTATSRSLHLFDFLMVTAIGRVDAPPWEDARTTEICDLIKRRLATQRLFPWKLETEELGYRRAKIAVNELGKELFPLIHRAEVRLTGARDLPTNQIP